MFLREPLLDSDIFTDLMIRVEMSPHHRVCAIGTDQIAGGKMSLPAVCTKNDMPFIILTPDVSAQAIVINLNAGGDQRFHPQVESMAINIDIASLVVTRERCGDVDSFDAEKSVDRRSHRQEASVIAHRSLRVRCQQTAARFAETFSTTLGAFYPALLPAFCLLIFAPTPILPGRGQ